MFTRLFGGGTARLRSFQTRTICSRQESIFSLNLPEKKLSIGLMSGGEKAPTALSPSCDLRIQDFAFVCSRRSGCSAGRGQCDSAGEIPRHYRDRVQFVIITHNKTTMEISDALYGVTMEEPGCSKIISVKLEEDRR
ncbi:MAG: hypothetical protein MZV49_04750 [Rhodopseudomonas palustris]|nr:hypothetical protein [Rhodopseudomonas palustris]